MVVMRYKATFTPSTALDSDEVVAVLNKLSDYLGASALTPIEVESGSVILTFVTDNGSAMKLFNVISEENGADQLSEAIGFKVLGLSLNGRVLFGSVEPSSTWWQSLLPAWGGAEQHRVEPSTTGLLSSPATPWLAASVVLLLLAVLGLGVLVAMTRADETETRNTDKMAADEECTSTQNTSTRFLSKRDESTTLLPVHDDDRNADHLDVDEYYIGSEARQSAGSRSFHVESTDNWDYNFDTGDRCYEKDYDEENDCDIKLVDEE